MRIVPSKFRCFPKFLFHKNGNIISQCPLAQSWDHLHSYRIPVILCVFFGATPPWRDLFFLRKTGGVRTSPGTYTTDVFSNPHRSIALLLLFKPAMLCWCWWTRVVEHVSISIVVIVNWDVVVANTESSFFITTTTTEYCFVFALRLRVVDTSHSQPPTIRDEDHGRSGIVAGLSWHSSKCHFLRQTWPLATYQRRRKRTRWTLWKC